jgi:RNA polymerase sigma-70 factor (ECF subfamily)
MSGTVPGEERSDRQLWGDHRGGDPEAFGVLVHRHRDRLWAVALRTTGNPEDAADALQDALVSAYVRSGSYRGDAAVTTWLHRIVVNACLDRLRRNKVRLADPLPDDLDDVAARGAVVAGSVADDEPAAHAEADERRRQVLAALDRIAPEQKVALVLVDMEGYPVEEAARILDCPTGTVKSRCARGRARLAQELRGTGLLPEPSDPGDRPGSGTETGRSTEPPGRPTQPSRGGATP